MPTPGNNPIVEIIGQSRDDAVTTTHVRLREGNAPAAPAAPAGLWRIEGTETHSIRDLHKLISSDEVEGTMTFESYDEAAPLLEPGSRFVLQPWWTPEQFEAAADTTVTWQLTTQDRGDHEHCLLTWQTISRGSVAYQSDLGWLSEEAYAKFIAADALRMRG